MAFFRNGSSGFSPGWSDILKWRDMTTAEARDPGSALRDAVAAERARLGSVKAAVAAVARQVGLTPRRVAAAWRQEGIALSWEEGEHVLRIAERRAQREMAELEARLACLRAEMGEDRSDGAVVVDQGVVGRSPGAQPACAGR